MRPFTIPLPLTPLVGQYVGHAQLESSLKGMGETHMNHVLRTWVMQGIPFAFQKHPLVYEAVRDLIALPLNILPVDVTIIGSGRIGYSLSEKPKFGRAFGPDSDLDFAIVSAPLFDRISADFWKWNEEIEYEIVPVYDNNQRSSLDQIPRNIGAGFIDPHKIPTRYNETRKVLKVIDIVNKKLKATPGLAEFTRAKIRIYKDWPSFERRLMFNFRRTKISL